MDAAVYCGAAEIEKDLLPALRKMYEGFEKQRVDTINRYGKVREALSLKLEEIDGKPYPHTYLDVPGAR